MAFVCGAIQRHKGPMSCGCKLIMKLMREVHNGRQIARQIARQSASEPLDAADEPAHRRMHLRLQALNNARERALSWTEKEPLHPSANKRDQLPGTDKMPQVRSGSDQSRGR